MTAFGRLAHLMYRRRWYVIGAWLIVLVIAVTQAAQVNSVLGPGDFSVKSSDAHHADDVLRRVFHQDDQRTVLVLLVDPSGTVTAPSFQRAITRAAHRLQADRALQVAAIDNPLLSHDRQLISRDGHAVLLSAISRLSEPKIEPLIDPLRASLYLSGVRTYVIGTPAVNHDYALGSEQDLSKGEQITVPILLIILLLVFGTAVAAALPLLLAGFSIVLSLAMVFAFGHVLSMTTYVANVVTILGLGIAIDYTLFIVYRFREELTVQNGDVEGAVVRTMETTGRAVFFSGLTVAIGLSSLILINLSFMQSMGLGGVLVPVTAVLVAMTLVPAALGVLGPRINRFRVLPTRFLQTGDGGSWHRLASAIMRRPWLSGGMVLIVMLALAYPATHLAFSFGTLKNAPPVESVEGYLYVQSHFTNTPDPTEIVVESNRSLLADTAGLRTLESVVRRDGEVTKVVGAADLLGTGASPALVGRYLSPDGRTAVVQVIPRHDVGTKQDEDLVKRLQSELSASRPFLRGDRISVGGAQAEYTAFNEAMYSKFPQIVGIVLLLSYLFLFLAFRSVFLPLKAVLLNLLSIGAAYGVLVLVFQGGVGASLLGLYPESGVASWVPIFLFAFLFGLSMDYEVFLLSRIRERWLATGENQGSVAFGLEKTGRLISSAAAIMVVAFSGFLVGHEIQLKEFSLGMMASVALDASLIRVILVPSIMAIMGRWNWWLPWRKEPVPAEIAAPESDAVGVS